MAVPDSTPPAPSKPTIVRRVQYLEVLLAPSENIEGVKAQLEELLKFVADEKPPRVLVDLRQIHFEPTVLDRYGLGVIGSRFTPYVDRVACVSQPKFIDPRKFGAQVAQNRGLKIEVFSDADEAVRWLTAP